MRKTRGGWGETGSHFSRRTAPFPKSRASYFRFARFNTSALHYLRAWQRLEIIELAYILHALRENFSVTWIKKGFTLCFTQWSVENYLCTRSHRPEENQNHDWSKKWFQQNSRYAVKPVMKGRFITASRSQELSLQRQLQIKFNLSMRQTILWSTIYPVLTQAIFKEISWPEYWSVLLNK